MCRNSRGVVGEICWTRSSLEPSPQSPWTALVLNITAEKLPPHEFDNVLGTWLARDPESLMLEPATKHDKCVSACHYLGLYILALDFGVRHVCWSGFGDS